MQAVGKERGMGHARTVVFLRLLRLPAVGDILPQFLIPLFASSPRWLRGGGRWEPEGRQPVARLDGQESVRFV